VEKMQFLLENKNKRRKDEQENKSDDLLRRSHPNAGSVSE